MRVLRHVGRAVLDVAGKDNAEWLIADGGRVVDLSGSTLLQTLASFTAPLRDAYTNVGASGGIETELRVELEAEVQARAGCGGALWATSGSDSIETALAVFDKFRALSGRPPADRFVVRPGSYHGFTMLTNWLSTRADPYRARVPAGSTQVVLSETRGDVDYVQLLERQDVASGSIVVLETVPTTGKNFWPGEESYRRVLEWCRERDVLVLLDECASGGYRHGWFSGHEWSTRNPPAASVVSKALTCGTYPLSCVLLREDIAVALKEHGRRPPSFTYGLNDASATLALACMSVYDRLRTEGRFDTRRRAVEECASSIRDRHPSLWVDTSPTTLRLGLCTKCLGKGWLSHLAARGLTAFHSGTSFSDVHLSFCMVCPPLDLAPELAAEYLDRFQEAVEGFFGSHRCEHLQDAAFV
jgi:adenosylmethionine-8-amino-7-oxononanoate aminotransferase